MCNDFFDHDPCISEISNFVSEYFKELLNISKSSEVPEGFLKTLNCLSEVGFHDFYLYVI